MTAAGVPAVSTAGVPAVLTVTCPDRRGIVAAVSGCLAAAGATIVDSQQFGDPGTGRFHMRVQVHVDADRAGRSLLNLAVDDLPAHLAELRARDLVADDPQTVTKGVQLASVTDPDGNVVTLIGDFRVEY